MRRKHGNYYEGKRYCRECSRLIDPRGWNRHADVHQPGGAGPLRAKLTQDNGTAAYMTAEIEVPNSLVDPDPTVVLSDGAIEEASKLFPTNPFLFNALTLMLSKPVTSDNLRAAGNFLFYAASRV